MLELRGILMLGLFATEVRKRGVNRGLPVHVLDTNLQMDHHTLGLVHLDPAE